MGAITVQNLTTLSLAASFTAMTTADEFVNNGHTFIYIKNSVAATNSVFVASQVSPVPVGLVAISVTVEVSVSGERMAGFFKPEAYNDSSGCVKLTNTTHTGLSIAAISVS